MADQNLKQKPPKNQSLHLFARKNDLLFFAYQINHPKRIDIDEFRIGKLRLFRKDKVYTAELKSKPFLNPSLLWNSETFELMLKKFDQFVLEQDNVDFSEWLLVSVYFKIKGKEINMLKIKMHQEFAIVPQAQLWNEFKKYHTFKSNYLFQTHKTIQLLESQIQIAIEKLEKTQQEQTLQVQDVKKKLSALMYEKEKKIMELTGNHLYQWQPQDESQQYPQDINGLLSAQHNQNNLIYSQEDRIIMGSLFAPSQDFLI